MGASVRSEAPSHYPSWGSETSQARVHLKRSLGSLPLMGIGNVHSFGIAYDDGTDLITPHGDRKRDQSCRSTLRTVISLPLMGIGNAMY